MDETEGPPGSPARLTVRFLTTIPSAAESSMQMDEESASACYAILHTGPEPGTNAEQTSSPKEARTALINHQV